ncbi:hypothetical protein FG05_35101 [Fusarium graminearum]|nr:hypothetical protein FG05_35101 [Fusarium graminearum]
MILMVFCGALGLLMQYYLKLIT